MICGCPGEALKVHQTRVHESPTTIFLLASNMGMDNAAASIYVHAFIVGQGLAGKKFKKKLFADVIRNRMGTMRFSKFLGPPVTGDPIEMTTTFPLAPILELIPN
jgi:hypothetical protein